MQLLSSEPLLSQLKSALKIKVSGLIDDGIEPQLGVVMVGNDPESGKYVSIKSRMAREVGVILSLYHLEENSSAGKTQEALSFLATDPDTDGVILQLPLPTTQASETDHLLSLIPPPKDVDGLNGTWKGVAYSGTGLAMLTKTSPYSLPPIVAAVLSLLDQYAIGLDGKKIVVVGRGRLVGQPIEAFLRQAGYTVETVDEETPSILEITRTADILITGTGQPELITYQWVKKGAVVINCAQDVHEDSVSQVASALSPAVGGIGPLTVYWLLHNVVTAARRRQGEQ